MSVTYMRAWTASNAATATPGRQLIDGAQNKATERIERVSMVRGMPTRQMLVMGEAFTQLEAVEYLTPGDDDASSGRFCNTKER
jgi:hypothetical protein